MARQNFPLLATAHDCESGLHRSLKPVNQVFGLRLITHLSIIACLLQLPIKCKFQPTSGTNNTLSKDYPHPNDHAKQITVALWYITLVRARKKDWDALVQWARESSLFPVQLLTLLVLWESWKELKVSLVQKYVPRNYVLNVLLSFGRVNTKSHLSHRQNNLSRTSGHELTLVPQTK